MIRLRLSMVTVWVRVSRVGVKFMARKLLPGQIRAIRCVCWYFPLQPHTVIR